jgi:DeoR family transcriptional regulator, aga operon transcriptional repressor
MGAMRPAERKRRVLELLETRDTVLVSELLEEFDVSEVTVRSDLSELARQGLVARVRGGARTLPVGTRQDEAAFDLRLALHAAEKHAIAKAAAAMVGDGEAIALDCSTTSYHIALELKDKKELVVVTNGLPSAEALARVPGVSVILVGGVLRPSSMSVVGDMAADVLRRTHINKGFFGVRGLSLERGLMDLNPEEVRLKRELAEACQQVVGVFDHTKWARLALLSFLPASDVSTIVTDDRAPQAQVDHWRARGVTVDMVATAPVAESTLVRGLRRRAPASQGTDLVAESA